MTKRICTLLLVLFFLSGCGQGLRTLMRVNKEQEAQHRDIAEQSRRFKLLCEHIEGDNLKLGLSIRKIIDTYGEPILEKEVAGQRRLLYREPLDYMPLEKAYLYFDAEDKLVDSELIVEEKEAQEEEKGLQAPPAQTPVPET